MNEDRKLPSNIYAEDFVMAIALSDKKECDLMMTSLTEADFTKPEYKYIFRALLALRSEEKEFSLSNVITKLEDLGYIESVGGIDAIGQLQASFVSTEGFDDSIKVLQDKTSARDLILKMRDLENDYYLNKFESDSSFVTLAEKDVNAIASNRRVDGFRNLKEISINIRNNIAIAKQSGSKIVGLDTGYADLNRVTMGFGKGEMIIIAARPSVGKTALGVNIAYNIAADNNKPVLMFSLEMQGESLGTRLLSATSSVEMKKILTGNLNQEELFKVESAMKKMSSVPLYIDNTPGCKIGDIVTKSKKFKASNDGLQMILIDYIGLINPDRKYESKRVEIGAISHELKALATQLEIPVVVISQLSRAVEGRMSKRPELQDLRESGDIEQDADKVILLYREDYNNNGKMNQNIAKNNLNAMKGSNFEESHPEENKPVDPMAPSMVEVCVAKNRNGETNMVYLWFFKAFSRFNNADRNDIDAYKSKNKLS